MIILSQEDIYRLSIITFVDDVHSKSLGMYGRQCFLLTYFQKAPSTQFFNYSIQSIEDRHFY